ASGITICRFTVGDIYDDRRKRFLMGKNPFRENVACLIQGLAHRRATECLWFEPDWEFDFLTDNTAGTIVHSSSAFFNSDRSLTDQTYRHQLFSGQMSA